MINSDGLSHLGKKNSTNWYAKTICNISFDHYLNGTLVPLGSSLNELDAIRMVKRLGVDMIQAWSQHHDGRAVYPTKYSEFHPGLNLLDFWGNVARKAGVRFCIYYSSLVNRIAAEKHPEWTQMNRNGVQYTRWNFGQMCPNSPFIEQLLLPQIDEMITAYAPDAFWFDGDSWAVHPCWCESCKRTFREKKGRELPADNDERNLMLVADFARESFENYHHKVVDLLREKNPDIQFCSNWAYTLRQPDDVPGSIGWLSGDVLPSGGLWQISLESRFLTNRGKPYDIMTWDQSVVLDKNGAWLTIAQKPLAQMMQEGSLILANGGRWFLWHSLLWDGWMSKAAENKLRDSISFARKIARFTLNTSSVTDIAVLHSQSSLHHSNLNDAIPNIRDSNDSLPGVRNFLVKARRHFDIVNEQDLIRRLSDYRLLILPEQVSLTGDVVESIREFVKHGGSVICAESGMWAERALPDLFRADPVAPKPSTVSEKIHPIEESTTVVSQLEDVFGVNIDGVIPARAGFIQANRDKSEAQPVFCYWYNVKLNDAKAVTSLWNHHDKSRSSLNSISSTLNHYGKGLAIYIPAPIFSSYGHLRYPFLQSWFEDKIDLISPSSLRISGEGNIEVSWRKRGKQQFVHLVNISSGEDLIKGNVFVQKIPMVGPFSLELDLNEKPARVRSYPANKEFRSRHTKGKLIVTIPKFEYITTIIIES